MPKGMNLEYQSFINLVNFFKPELERIIEGEPAASVLPERTTRKTLRKHGVLTKRYNRDGGGGSISAVTEAALEVLKDE